MILLGGCAGAAPPIDRRVFAEWHVCDLAFGLDPVREDVVVFDDGRVVASFGTTGTLSGWPEFTARERSFVLSGSQRATLVRLLRELDRMRRDGWESTGLICVLLDPGEPCFSTETITRFSPVRGLEWEFRRSRSDSSWPFWRMTEELRRHVEDVDEFFRSLLWAG